MTYVLFMRDGSEIQTDQLTPNHQELLKTNQVRKVSKLEFNVWRRVWPSVEPPPHPRRKVVKKRRPQAPYSTGPMYRGPMPGMHTHPDFAGVPDSGLSEHHLYERPTPLTVEGDWDDLVVR